MFWEIFSTFVNVASAIKEGNAAVRSAQFNRNISNYNAGVTRQAGKLEEDRVRRTARQQTGLVRANLGASGVDMGDDVVFASIYAGELDALTTRFNYNAQAESYEMQGSLYGQQAKDARTGTYLSAASQLLKGGTDYYKNNQDYGAGTTPFRLGGGSTSSQLPWLAGST